MLVLVVDTSTPAVTAGLVDVSSPIGGQPVVHVLARRVVIEPRRHSEVLAPSVEAILSAAGVAMAEVSAVVAGAGPGPFTGLRVGLATAAAIGAARGIPTYAVCSLDAIGARLAVPGLLVATDARRREVYWATYGNGARREGPAVDAPAVVAARLLGSGVTAMAGPGARQYAEVLGLPFAAQDAAGDGPEHLGDYPGDYPGVAELAGLAGTRVLAGAPGEQLVPLYLRSPDATPPVAVQPQQ